jgi:hypothetical protein
MTLEEVYYVSQIVAVIAIFGSLIFVGVQLRQNTRATQMASLQSVLDGCRDRFFVPGYTDPNMLRMFAQGLTDMNALSADDKRKFNFLLFDQCFQMQHVMQLHEHGTLAKVDFDAWLYYVASLFKCPGGAGMWPFIKTSITPTIRELIEGYLAKNPSHPSYLELNPLFRAGDSASVERAQSAAGERS